MANVDDSASLARVALWLLHADESQSELCIGLVGNHLFYRYVAGLRKKQVDKNGSNNLQTSEEKVDSISRCAQDPQKAASREVVEDH